MEMKKYPDFWHTLLGGGSLGTFLAYVVIAYICAGVIILAGATRRNVASAATPVKFSLRFLLADNLLRMVANFLLIPIAIRVTYDRVDSQWAVFVSMGIGFGVDGLALLAKNMGLLTTNFLANKIAAKLAATDLTVTTKTPTDGKN